MMRDRQERVCSSNWDVKAELSAKDQSIKLPIAANTVEPSDREFFKEEPPGHAVNTDPIRSKSKS